MEMVFIYKQHNFLHIYKFLGGTVFYIYVSLFLDNTAFLHLL